MDKTVQKILEMAEWFKKNGDMESYNKAKWIATRLLDYIMYVNAICQPNSEASRKLKSQGQRSGACARAEL